MKEYEQLKQMRADIALLDIKIDEYNDLDESDQVEFSDEHYSLMVNRRRLVKELEKVALEMDHQTIIPDRLTEPNGILPISYHMTEDWNDDTWEDASRDEKLAAVALSKELYGVDLCVIDMPETCCE
jgi:hypothetical protein